MGRTWQRNGTWNWGTKMSFESTFAPVETINREIVKQRSEMKWDIVWWNGRVWRTRNDKYAYEITKDKGIEFPYLLSISKFELGYLSIIYSKSFKNIIEAKQHAEEFKDIK
jgi:hypothetical protein